MAGALETILAFKISNQLNICHYNKIIICLNTCAQCWKTNLEKTKLQRYSHISPTCAKGLKQKDKSSLSPKKTLMQLNQFLMSWFRVQMHENMLSKFMSFKRKIANALLFSSFISFTGNKSCQFISSLGVKMQRWL